MTYGVTWPSAAPKHKMFCTCILLKVGSPREGQELQLMCFTPFNENTCKSVVILLSFGKKTKQLLRKSQDVGAKVRFTPWNFVFNVSVCHNTELLTKTYKRHDEHNVQKSLLKRRHCMWSLNSDFDLCCCYGSDFCLHYVCLSFVLRCGIDFCS